jgi:hypothetical protein
MSIFDDPIFWIGYAVFFLLIAGSNYVMIIVIERYWNFESREPSKQLMNKMDLYSHLTNGPLYFLWFLISIIYYQSLIALGLGILALLIVPLLFMLRKNSLQRIPFHVFNYNYAIGSPKSHRKVGLIPLPNLNKKIGRRFEYWRGHGRFL